MKVVNPYTSRSSGTLGGSVFYTSLSKNIVRSKPLSYTNNPNEHTQQLRDRFSAINVYYKSIRYFIEFFFHKSKTYQSSKSFFISKNINNIDLATSKLELAKAGQITVATGNLGYTGSFLFSYSVTNGLYLRIQGTFNYPYSPVGVNYAVVLYNVRLDVFMQKKDYIENGIEHEAKIENTIPGDEILCYVVFWYSNNNVNTSTIYVGSTNAV